LLSSSAEGEEPFMVVMERLPNVFNINVPMVLIARLGKSLETRVTVHRWPLVSVAAHKQMQINR
jgi:hypothetical protein